ncbi:MAG: hypothetical protein AAFU79_16510, partial [Myxococcota bacterium]
MSIKVGDDIDSKCLPSCGPGLVLAHTIVAMDGDKIVRVKCNTCQKTHTYRSPDSASEATAAKRKSARKKREEAATAAAVDFDDLAKSVDLSQAAKYSTKEPLEAPWSSTWRPERGPRTWRDRRSPRPRRWRPLHAFCARSCA